MQEVITTGMEGAALKDAINGRLNNSTMQGLKMANLGDSQDVSTWWSTVASDLGITSTLGLATAGARHNDNEGGTTVVNVTTYGSVTVDNTLSNQVRALVRDSFTNGAQVTWTHPMTSEVVTLPTAAPSGTGLGNTKPDIITIKFGQNGGEAGQADAVFDSVIAQNYLDLTRTNQYSSMRWAFETIRLNFPLAHVFIITAPPTTSASSTWYATLKARNDMTIKMAKYFGFSVINLFEESGISVKMEKVGAAGWHYYDGIHPGNGSNSTYNGIALAAKFIGKRMKEYFLIRNPS
jgi:hypothetical protein